MRSHIHTTDGVGGCYYSIGLYWDSTENVLVAQNAAVAAESLGLVAVFISGVRNQIATVAGTGLSRIWHVSGLSGSSAVAAAALAAGNCAAAKQLQY